MPEPAAITTLAQAATPDALATEEVIARVLLALALVLLAARLVGGLFARFGQPRVVGEMVAGILLGPTVLGGTLARAGSTEDGIPPVVGNGLVDALFPLEVFEFLDLIGTFGLVLFMFLLGLEVDRRLLRGRGMQISVVSVALVALPVAAGFFAAAILDSPSWKPEISLSGEPVTFTTHALFIGAALSVSASAVLARILQEKRMLANELGAVSIGASTVVTTLMFIVLAAAAGSAEGQGIVDAVGAKLLGTIALIAVLALVVRPALSALVKRSYDPDRPLPDELLAALLFGALVTALASDRIGINALTGGFLFGMVVPQVEGLGRAVIDRLGTILVVLLVPVFLTVSGLQTDLTVIRPELIGGILLFLFLALLTKWAAAVPVGIAAGLDWRRANALGILLNCRGLEILIVALVGTQLGVISGPMQAAFVIAALVTTLMTAPAVDLFLPGGAVESEREKSIHQSMLAIPTMTGGPRVIAVPATPGDALAVTAAAERFLGEDPPPQFLVANLPGLRPRGEVIGHGVWEEARDVATLLGWLGPIADRLRAGGGDAEAVSFQSPTPNEDLVKLAADWAATHVIATDPELIAELEEAGIPTERAETPAA